MKRIVLLLIQIVSVIILFAQEFSTKIYFRDNAGNKDTITVGYSLYGSRDSLNATLGEYNIPESQIDTNFFAGIRWFNSDQSSLNRFMKPVFRTKIKYVDFKEPDYRRTISIDVICKNFPLILSWDKVVFQDTIRSKSYITTTHPGGWFDVGGYTDWLSESDSVVFYDYDRTQDYSKFYLYNTDNSTYYLDSIQSKPLKIGSLYIGFLEHNYSLGIENMVISNVSIYPNPCGNILNINFENNDLKKIQIYDSLGKLIINKFVNGKNERLDISDLNKGICVMKIINNNKINTIKIIKE